MNKDTVMAYFEVHGNGSLEYISGLKATKDYNDKFIGDLGAFLLDRRAPKHREHIEELLRRSGCNTLSGFLDVSHALSLNDTIWVKGYEQNNICWDKVSLYRNRFNSVISRVAFTGGMYGYELSTTSPEYGTNGSFAKCWIREDGIIKLIKQGSSGASNAGLEPFSEFYTSQVMEALGIKHVDYTLTHRYGRLASKCNLFTNEKYGLIPFSKIAGTVPIGSVVAFYKEHGIMERLAEMLIADSITFNEDRHLGNFGFIIDNDIFKIMETAPLYDHNISLLCYAVQEDFNNIEKYIRGNNKGHKLGGDFVSIAKEVLTPKMRKRLINIHGFKFKKHRRYNLPDWRLEALNKIVNNQIEKILR